MLDKIQEYLDLLEIDANASKEDIRKAFKRLALKYHPDKSSCSNNELFNKLVEAKNVLLAWQGPFYKPIHSIEDSQLMDKLLNELIESVRLLAKKALDKSLKKKKKRANRLSRYDIVLDIEVTLDEIYSSKVKKLQVKVKRETGEIQIETMYISLFNYTRRYTFEGKGDYIDENTRGNVYVNLIIKTHEYLRIDQVNPYDLFIDYNIPLFEYYYRHYLALPFLNNELLEIEEIKPGQKCACVKGKGLPYYDSVLEENVRGVVYVYFNIVLPESIPDECKEFLKTFFNGII
jgi:DnaJ-class molecular chaperone